MCKMRVVAISVASLAILAWPASARAEATIDVARDTEIVWVEAGSDGTGGFKVTILTPREDGKRRVWQRCSFDGSVAGTYRCGIDAGPGSMAADR